MRISGLFAEYVLILCYIYFSLSWLVKRKRLRKVLELFFESILVIIGMCQIRSENFRLLPITLVICMIYFPLMILMTSTSIRQIWSIFRFKSPHRFKLRFLNTYPAILLNVAIEELIWRICYVYLLSQLQIPVLIIAVSGSILFTIAHWRNDKKLVLLEQSEFILFSLMLYTLFLIYESFLLIWLIHFFRNIIIKGSQSITSND
jgi:hypothetical protein